MNKHLTEGLSAQVDRLSADLLTARGEIEQLTAERDRLQAALDNVERRDASVARAYRARTEAAEADRDALIAALGERYAAPLRAALDGGAQ